MQYPVAFIASACFEKEVSTASVFMFTIQRNLLFKAIVCSRKKPACYINLRVSQRTASCDLLKTTWNFWRTRKQTRWPDTQDAPDVAIPPTAAHALTPQDPPLANPA